MQKLFGGFASLAVVVLAQFAVATPARAALPPDAPAEFGICAGLAFTAELACNAVINDSGACASFGSKVYQLCTII